MSDFKVLLIIPFLYSLESPAQKVQLFPNDIPEEISHHKKPARCIVRQTWKVVRLYLQIFRGTTLRSNSPEEFNYGLWRSIVEQYCSDVPSVRLYNCVVVQTETAQGQWKSV